MRGEGLLLETSFHHGRHGWMGMRDMEKGSVMSAKL